MNLENVVYSGLVGGVLFFRYVMSIE